MSHEHDTMKQALKKFFTVTFFRPFFSLRTSKSTFNYFNKSSKALWDLEKEKNDDITKRIAKELKENGISFTSIDELFPSTDWLSKLKDYVEKERPNGIIREGKPYLLALTKDDHLDFTSPFIKITLSPIVLRIASSYIDVLAKFYYSYLDITLPVAPSSQPFRSQNWHRDPEDLRICKMFVYVNDVDEKSGPFIYLRGSQKGGKYENMWPQKPPKGSYPEPGELEKKINPDDVVTCTGKAGTIIFADTAGLHRGGYATEKERVMYTAEFASKAALRSELYKNGNGAPSDLPSEAKRALLAETRIVAKSLQNITGFAIKHGLY